MENISYSEAVLNPREKQSVDTIVRTICEKIDSIFRLPIIGGQIKKVVVGLAEGFDQSLQKNGLDNRYVGAIATKVWNCLGQKLLTRECHPATNCSLEKGKKCPF